MHTNPPSEPHPALAHLLDRRLWIFDMDGTLTVPAHDFAAFRQAHDLPEGVDLLDLSSLSPSRAERVREAIRVWEWEVAERTLAQADALVLVQALAARGTTLAVLTRNLREVAMHTLKMAGLLSYFPVHELIIGRDCATPKPDPAGVLHLARVAGIDPSDAVMVGDWVHDVAAGRRAGASTVLVERHGPSPAEWSRWVDVSVSSLCGPSSSLDQK